MSKLSNLTNTFREAAGRAIACAAARLKRRNGNKPKSYGKPTVTHDRALSTWAAIGAIAVPIACGILLATPGGIGAVMAIRQAADAHDGMRLIAIFCALNTAATVSGLMYLIGRNWHFSSLISSMAGEMSELRSGFERLTVEVEFMKTARGSSGKKKRNAPATWSGLSSYIGFNPRLLKEVEFALRGDGTLQLRAHPEWVDMWIDRLQNQKLSAVEVILYVSRGDSILTQATGRTLLRFAKLLDAIVAAGQDIDWSKLRVKLVESAEIHRSFFIVHRENFGRPTELVLQYSRSIVEHGDGAITDVETVEEISDPREKEKFKVAATRVNGQATAVEAEAVRAVFRDLLRPESFAPLKEADWRERINALMAGVDPKQVEGFSFVENGSEFSIFDHPFPWESRRTGDQQENRGLERIFGRRFD